MYMADWLGKLDDFIRNSDREILKYAAGGKLGSVPIRSRASSGLRLDQ